VLILSTISLVIQNTGGKEEQGSYVILSHSNSQSLITAELGLLMENSRSSMEEIVFKYQKAIFRDCF